MKTLAIILALFVAVPLAGCGKPIKTDKIFSPDTGGHQ
jgi:hypothetical protein